MEFCAGKRSGLFAVEIGGYCARVAQQARKSSCKKKAPAQQKRPFGAHLRRLIWRGAFGVAVLAFLLVGLFSVINPPTTHTIWSETRRLGDVDHQWVPIDEVAPVVLRAIVAAEDANFCRHWGFDMGAIRAAISDGGARGASTLTQQTVKNVYLWQGRSWPRKAAEALLTPMVETLWSKRRILEVYLNVAEFGEGIFGIEAAAHHYFRVSPDRLSPMQAARLAVILPNPKERNAADLPDWLLRHARRVVDGAATIRADGRAACFET